MTVSEVRRWYVDWFKINHVVMSDIGGWVSTLCDDVSTGQSDPTPTARKNGKVYVCKTCRKRLANARPVSK